MPSTRQYAYIPDLAVAIHRDRSDTLYNPGILALSKHSRIAIILSRTMVTTKRGSEMGEIQTALASVPSEP
jgi:hypothetical protein